MILPVSASVRRLVVAASIRATPTTATTIATTSTTITSSGRGGDDHRSYWKQQNQQQQYRSIAMSSSNSNSRNRLTPVAIHRTIDSIRNVRKALHPGVCVGFVPTMGALHEGHLSLVRQAREQNDIVIASIFVNPTQFGPTEDLDKYPRQLEQDTKLLSDLGVDHLFLPDASTMYRKNHSVYVVPEGFDSIPEGKVRPGHFRGVATVVTKLFNIVQPTRAYFGQKDAAQCVLIRRLVQDLDLDVAVEVLDTVRESDGLAMSSRNAYLTASERRAAPVVYQALCNARARYHQLSESESISSDELRHIVESTLRMESLVTAVQYVSVDSKETMQPINNVEQRDGGAIISLACKIGSVRLIDNIIL